MHVANSLIGTYAVESYRPSSLQNAYLNLLMITATIRSTRTVMIAIVTILLVAILHQTVSTVKRATTTGSASTFAPCPSASCCSCPYNPRSPAACHECARSSHAAC